MLAGGYLVSLPFMDATSMFAWLWFCAWIAALPVMVACLVALGLIVRRDRSALSAAVLCGAAIVLVIPPTVSHWHAAGLGLVRAGPKRKAGKEELASLRGCLVDNQSLPALITPQKSHPSVDARYRGGCSNAVR